MSLNTFMTTALFAIVTMCAGVVAAQKTKPVATTSENSSDDRALIEKNVASYVAAFNAKDAKALAAHWSPEGVYVDRITGEQMTGRDSIEESYAKSLSVMKDSQLEVQVESIDFVSPNVAIENGTATVTGPEPVRSEYSAVHVKRDGQWLIDRISEAEIVLPPSHYEQLKDLEWMIGNWVDQSGEGTVTTECHWARNNNFIIRSFTVPVGDTVDMAGMQIIGWDPVRKQIRSWVFDSDGGFNEGLWQQVDQKWIVGCTATLPDGRRATSDSIMKLLDEDRFTWQQVNRFVDGEMMPNLEEVVIVRNSPK
ncbi:YybH family protein [Novipirellula sp. SH528]|uniref:YybH family protein n=1 Tax=Novipirellula sp. SH528 TaxID=3454466 RepID=UPI003F9F6B23